MSPLTTITPPHTPPAEIWTLGPMSEGANARNPYDKTKDEPSSGEVSNFNLTIERATASMEEQVKGKGLDVLSPATLDQSKPANTLIAASLYSKQERVLRDISSYRSLRMGWDGEGGEAFNSRVVSMATQISFQIIGYMRNQNLMIDRFASGAASDGTIVLELDARNRELIFIIDGDAKTVEFYDRQLEDSRSHVIRYEELDLEDWLSRSLIQTNRAS